MAEIKIKIDQELPSREEITKYKNFDSLMDSYKKYYTTRGIREMLYKDRKKLVYLVIILLMLLLLLFLDETLTDPVTTLPEPGSPSLCFTPLLLKKIEKPACCVIHLFRPV